MCARVRACVYVCACVQMGVATEKVRPRMWEEIVGGAAAA